MSDTVLVTGASGFVGREAMRAAHEQIQWICESDERRELGRAAGGEPKQ
jgi:uncharacterized protein YbjT (DUF2867 family)